MSLKNIIAKCHKYDEGAQTVESCLPKTMTRVKKLYQIIKECDMTGLCNDHGPGFARSFLLGILESNTALSSDIDTYITDVLHVPYESRTNPETGFFETDIEKRIDKIDNKEFAEYYRNYHKIIDLVNKLLLQSDTEMEKISISDLKKVLDDYLEVAIAFCVYVSELEDVEMHFRTGCNDLKKKPRK